MIGRPCTTDPRTVFNVTSGGDLVFINNRVLYALPGASGTATVTLTFKDYGGAAGLTAGPVTRFFASTSSRKFHMSNHFLPHHQTVIKRVLDLRFLSQMVFYDVAGIACQALAHGVSHGDCGESLRATDRSTTLSFVLWQGLKLYLAL